MIMKKTFKVNIWSSEEKFPTDANTIQREIYEIISGLDTVKVSEINTDKLYKVFTYVYQMLDLEQKLCLFEEFNGETYDEKLYKEFLGDIMGMLT